MSLKNVVKSIIEIWVRAIGYSILWSSSKEGMKHTHCHKKRSGDPIPRNVEITDHGKGIVTDMENFQGFSDRVEDSFFEFIYI